MTENNMAWYQEPEGGKLKLPLCGLDGDQPCSRIQQPDGSYVLLSTQAPTATDDGAWGALSTLAEEMNAEFTRRAGAVLAEARKEFKLGPDEPLEIRVVVRQSGLKLTFASCDNPALTKPWHHFEKVIKAGQEALGKPPKIKASVSADL